MEENCCYWGGFREFCIDCSVYVCPCVCHTRLHVKLALMYVHRVLYWESDGLRSISQLEINRLESNNKCSSTRVIFISTGLGNNQSRYDPLWARRLKEEKINHAANLCKQAEVRSNQNYFQECCLQERLAWHQTLNAGCSKL